MSVCPTSEHHALLCLWGSRKGSRRSCEPAVALAAVGCSVKAFCFHVQLCFHHGGRPPADLQPHVQWPACIATHQRMGQIQGEAMPILYPKHLCCSHAAVKVASTAAPRCKHEGCLCHTCPCAESSTLQVNLSACGAALRCNVSSNGGVLASIIVQTNMQHIMLWGQRFLSGTVALGVKSRCPWLNCVD